MATTGQHEQQQSEEEEEEEDEDALSFGVSPVLHADGEDDRNLIARMSSASSLSSSSIGARPANESAELEAVRTMTTDRRHSIQSLDFVEDNTSTGIPALALETSMSRKQGWLPFPRAKKKKQNSSHSSNPSTSTTDSQEDESNSSLPMPPDESPAGSSFPSPLAKLYEIKVRKLFYKLPPPKQSLLTRLQRTFRIRRSPKEADHDAYKRNARYILRNITFTARPGELLGIAGPSGAGKSTILECLAGRVTPSSPPGCILVNDNVMNSSTFRRISGYVMQDDALFPTLTVMETLLFSARLRLPSTMTTTEKLSRVQGLLVELGLLHAANTRIGNEMIRGVSGGERRRVSIGVDVIHDPAVLILDEPTSGLDSGAALNVVAMLRAMAVSRRRTVILSVHQPSFRILQLMHSILLVAGGMVVHHGGLDLLATRLATAGHEVPAQTNVMEYAIDAVNSWETEEFIGNYATIGDGFTLQEMFALGEDFYCRSRKDHRSVDLENGLVGGQLAEGEEEASERDGRHPPTKISYANNIFQETIVLTERFFKNILRTRELFTARGLQALIAGVVLGTVFLNMGKDRQGVSDRMGYFVFTLSYVLNSTTEALPIFLQERQILLRETSRGAYRLSSYVLSHTVVFVPFFVPIALLYCVPSYWLAGLTASTGSFLFYCLVLWLTLLLANSFVAFFSALVQNYIMGQALVAACIGAFFLFSGYIINRHNIPRYWIWMHYLSLFKYPFESLLLNEFSSHRTDCYDSGSSASMAAAAVVTSSSHSSGCQLTGSQVLDIAGVQGHQKWIGVAATVGFILVYRISCYVALRWRVARCCR